MQIFAQWIIINHNRCNYHSVKKQNVDSTSEALSLLPSVTTFSLLPKEITILTCYACFWMLYKLTHIIYVLFLAVFAQIMFLIFIHDNIYNCSWFSLFYVTLYVYTTINIICWYSGCFHFLITTNNVVWMHLY